MKTRARLFSAAVIAYAISGCTGGTEPAVPASIAASSSVTPTATAGLVLTDAPTFSVKDASGKTIGGVAITIAVTAGGGTLANSPSTTASGSPTSVGAWTLGKVAGVNLNAVAATTLFVVPAGVTRCVVTRILKTNYSMAATTASASFGASGTPTDWAATAVDANAATTRSQLLIPTATLATQYAAATAFVANVTIAQGAAATCDITVFGICE